MATPSQWQGAASGAASGAVLGTEILPGWGTAIGGVIGGAAGYLGTPKRPKYNVLPESDQNKALAAASAFGINPSVQRGISLAEQQAAEDTNTAQNYTSNTSSILNVLKSLNSNKNLAAQAYLGQNAQLQTQGRQQLMGANMNAIDEQDKGWNYNINQPYQNLVQGNREIMKGSTENIWRLLDSLKAQGYLKNQVGPNATLDV